MPAEGMDIDEANRLLAAINSQQQQFQGLIATVDSHLESLNWSGHDQESFLESWRGWSSRFVSSMHSVLGEAARNLQREIGQQQRASAT